MHPPAISHTAFLLTCTSCGIREEDSREIAQIIGFTHTYAVIHDIKPCPAQKKESMDERERGEKTRDGTISMEGAAELLERTEEQVVDLG